MRGVAADLVLVIGVVSLCSGCGSADGGVLAGKSIDRSWPVYISPIVDAMNTADDTHIGSGAATQAEFSDTLAKRGLKVAPFPSPGTYTLEVRYTRWEDHATQWTGVPDVIEFSAKLLESSNGSPAAVTRSGVTGSIFEITNPSPKALIPKAVQQTLDRFYR